MHRRSQALRRSSSRLPARVGACLLAAAGAALLLACTAARNPHYDATRPHHTPEGFRNNYIDRLTNEGGFWKWQWERLRAGVPPPPANGYAFPRVTPDAAWLRSNRGEPAATWIGHATVLLQMGGLNILTDPHFSERASPVSFAGPKRHVPPALAIEALPHIDLVVISHNHYDHLDLETVKALSRQPGGSPRFFVPLGQKAWFAEQGIDAVEEMDWWERRDYRGIEIHFTPVQHWSARSLTDRMRTLWGGWYLRAPARGGMPALSAFFAGDTGYSKDFADIAARLGAVDFAIVPIGAYEPRWFMSAQHVDPAEAIRMHQDLRSRLTLGMHWGTFELTDEPLDEPPLRLARERERLGVAPERFVAVRHGETLRLGPALTARDAVREARSDPAF